MTDFSIRFATPADAPALFEYEKEYFPAVDGQYHAGYAYAGSEIGDAMLSEKLAAPRRSFTIVAESDDTIVGFAAAIPFRLPGTKRIDSDNMVLNYLAVDPAHRRSGIAKALVQEIERRAIRAKQKVIVAHVSPTAVNFYQEIGWDVVAEGSGYAWQPFKGHLRADHGDAEIGFPIMTAKVLRPLEVRRTFYFLATSGRPTLDAATRLAEMLDAGDIDPRTLDAETREFVEMSRSAPPAGAPRINR
jgi:predicted N-acetyltransferase YhbS